MKPTLTVMSAPSPQPFTLDQAVNYRPYVIQSVDAPSIAPEWQSWLEEIGFIPGEQVMVMARSLPGGDPLVVRVGGSTFALRLIEAACVHVVTVEAMGTLEVDTLASAAA
jgi:ferrous iron transport protein A